MKDARLPGSDLYGIQSGGLCAGPLGIDCIPTTLHQITVDSILHIAGTIGGTEQARDVGLVLSEEQRCAVFADHAPLAEIGMRERDHAVAELPQHWPGAVSAP